MRRAILLALVGSIFAAAPAPAATWARLTDSEIGDTTWVDLDSIKAAGSERRAWVRWKYGRSRSKGATEAVDLSSYNCATREIMTLHHTSYDSTGMVVGSITARPYEMEWHPALPDSMGDRHLNFVCTYPIGTDPRQIEGLEIEP